MQSIESDILHDIQIVKSEIDFYQSQIAQDNAEMVEAMSDMQDAQNEISQLDSELSDLENERSSQESDADYYFFEYYAWLDEYDYFQYLASELWDEYVRSDDGYGGDPYLALAAMDAEYSANVALNIAYVYADLYDEVMGVISVLDNQISSVNSSINFQQSLLASAQSSYEWASAAHAVDTAQLEAKETELSQRQVNLTYAQNLIIDCGQAIEALDDWLTLNYDYNAWISNGFPTL